LVFYPNKDSEDYFDLVNLTSAFHGKKLDKLGEDMLRELVNEMFRVDPRLHGEVTNTQFSSYYWNAKAKFWANQNMFEKSLPLYERAIAFYPTNCEAFYGKGLALANLGRYKEAIESYDIVINLDNRNKKAWCQKGCALDSQGNYSDSIDCFNHAISIDPLYLDAWHNKGNALFDLENLIEALDCYNKVINIDPDHFDAWKEMGSTLHMLEEFEEAIVCFERAIRIKPNERITGKVWFEKNEVLRKMGKDVEAEEAWGMALECDETLGVSG
jgi:tetratricopeptide (TPR) repeat protein